MKVGLGLCPQNYLDWERYAAGAWGTAPRTPDAHIYDDAVALAELAELANFDSVWSVEHHFTPYIMVPNPIQLLTYIAGARSMDLVDHFLMAWGSPESLPSAANAGLKPLFIPQRTWKEYAEQVREFNAIRARRGWAPAGATAAVWMYCAPSRSEAEEQGEQYVTEYTDSVRLHYLLDQPEVFQSVSGYERYTERATALAAAIQSGVDPKQASRSTTTSTHVIGTPEECLEQLRGISEALGIEHLILVLQFGTMPREQAQRSLRLVAEHVAPTLQRLQLAPL